MQFEDFSFLTAKLMNIFIFDIHVHVFVIINQCMPLFNTGEKACGNTQKDIRSQK